MAQINSEQLVGIEGIGLIVGNRDKNDLAEIIDKSVEDFNLPPKIVLNPITPADKPPLVVYSSRHQRQRAFVKIQDGCDSGCTYCIVPSTRGPARSKRPEHIIEEVWQLISLGYKEIVLTGIHTGLYGIEPGMANLDQLLTALLTQLPGEYRLRLSSLEPTEISRDLLALMKTDARLCPHLHIPLQSGSDKILKLMGRNYDAEFYRRLLLEISILIPDIALVADVIVGFPGETENDFQASYELLAGLPLLDLHVFQYSPRPQTLAAEFPGQVAVADKQKRSHILLDLAQQKKAAFLQQTVGKDMRVLVEKKLGEYNIGFSDNYIPVRFKADEDLSGELVWVRIERTDGEYCIGGV